MASFEPRVVMEIPSTFVYFTVLVQGVLCFLKIIFRLSHCPPLLMNISDILMYGTALFRNIWVLVGVMPWTRTIRDLLGADAEMVTFLSEVSIFGFLGWLFATVAFSKVMDNPGHSWLSAVHFLELITQLLPIVSMDRMAWPARDPLQCYAVSAAAACAMIQVYDVVLYSIYASGDDQFQFEDNSTMDTFGTMRIASLGSLIFFRQRCFYFFKFKAQNPYLRCLSLVHAQTAAGGLDDSDTNNGSASLLDYDYVAGQPGAAAGGSVAFTPLATGEGSSGSRTGSSIGDSTGSERRSALGGPGLSQSPVKISRPQSISQSQSPSQSPQQAQAQTQSQSLQGAAEVEGDDDGDEEYEV